MSSFYDWLAGSAEGKYEELGLKKLGAQAGESVLEIGFGTGHSLLALARAVGPAGRVAGIDLSEEMFKVAQTRVRKAGFSGRIALTCQDALKLPYESDRFDALFMSFTLELFDTPEIPMLLQESHRVLRPGGRLCVVAMSKQKQDSLTVKLYEWIHDHFTRYLDCRPIFVQPVITEAGFHIVGATQTSMFRLPVAIVLAKKG
jgi:demethylmenaquinone methyltransferase/2-methoxy-6-polyprenyl-1,4-benzoquinol methylase